jgi:hypothetical protein
VKSLHGEMLILPPYPYDLYHHRINFDFRITNK